MDSTTLFEWPVEFGEVQACIRRIPQYEANVTISLERLAPGKLTPICLYVRAYRLNQVQQLIAAYHFQAIPLFEAVRSAIKPGSSRLIIPPLIELHGSQYIIVDGLHRIYEVLHTQSRHPITVAVIQGNLPPPPADLLKWSEVQLTQQKLPRNLKFRNFRPSLFRDIKRYIDAT